MANPWDLQLKLLKGVLILNTIIGGISFLIFDPWIPFLMGLIFGTIIALLNFQLLFLTLEKAVNMPPGNAQVYTASRYVIRFLFTAIVLFISIKADYINVLGTIVGLISLKLIILKTEVFNNSQFYKNILKRKEEQ